MLLTLTYTQRRFAFEHPQLLDRVADDDDDNDDAADGHSCASTQPEAPESEEGSRPSSTMSSISQRGKRRKNNPLPACYVTAGTFARRGLSSTAKTLRSLVRVSRF